MGSLDCAHAGTWRLATRAAPPPRARRTCRREYGPMAWMLPSPPCRSESSWRRPPSCSAGPRRPPRSPASARPTHTARPTGPGASPSWRNRATCSCSAMSTRRRSRRCSSRILACGSSGRTPACRRRRRRSGGCSIGLRCSGSSWRSAPTSRPTARSTRSGARSSSAIPTASWWAPTRGRPRAGSRCARPRRPCSAGCCSCRATSPSRSPGRTVSVSFLRPEATLRALRRRSESRDQLEVGIVAQPRPRVGRIGPQHLVHLVVVLADLPQRPHAIPSYRFSDALAVALKPVGHRLQLAHDLALPAGFFAHLAQGGVGGRLAGIERALGQRPHGLVAEIARADEQHAAPLVDDETAGGELQQRVRPRRRAHDLMIPSREPRPMLRPTTAAVVVVVALVATGAVAQPAADRRLTPRQADAADAYGEALRRTDPDAHARYVRLREARDP